MKVYNRMIDIRIQREMMTTVKLVNVSSHTVPFSDVCGNLRSLQAFSIPHDMINCLHQAAHQMSLLIHLTKLKLCPV